MKRTAKRLTALSIAILAVGLAGCAKMTFYAYHPDEHKLARAAQTAFKDASLVASLAAERAAMDAQLTRELAAVRRDQSSLRDEKLAAFITSSSRAMSWDPFRQDIERRIAILLGGADPAKAAASLRGIIPEIERTTRQIAQEQDAFYLATLNAGKGERVSCTEKALKRPDPVDVYVRGAWRVFHRACADFLKATTGLQSIQSGGGLLKEATESLAALEALAGRVKSQSEIAAAAYDTALDEYKSKLKAGGAQGALEAFADDLKAKLGALDKIAGTASAAASAPIIKEIGLTAVVDKLKRQKQAADDLLAAAAESGAAPKEASPEASLLLRIAASVTAFEKAIDPKFHPTVALLLLESEMLRLELTAAEKRVARANESIALVREKRNALLEEVRALDQANLRLTTAAKACPINSSLLADYQTDKQGACRIEIAGALIAYSLAWEIGRIPAEQAEYKQIGLEHQYALDQAEAALAQTETLIAAPLERLVALYGSGIKPEHLSNLIQAIGLGAIAVNVK